MSIKLKTSDVPGKIPALEDLQLGELAVNTADGELYLKRDKDGEISIEKFTFSNPIDSVIFVQKSGSDDNSGDSWDSAYLTIEKAVEDAWTRDNEIVLIEIGPGIYESQGHIDMPDNSIIHCVYRSVKIRPEPGYEERNVFRMGSGCFIEGPVFEGWRVDDFDNPTEGFAAVFREGALITRTPYVHKVAVRSIPNWSQVAPPLDRENGNPFVPRGGGVVLADGAIISPYSIYPNIMTWGATPVIHNGIGYVAKNGGLVNAVNAISIWAHKHFLAIDGGQIILSACSTQFGDYTLVSQGTRKIIESYEIDQNTLPLTVETESANSIYSNAEFIINTMYEDLVDNGFTNYDLGGEVADPDLTFEDYTKRDANLFLRSITWTLASANEKPSLDFAKGFFDTKGNATFERAAYDVEKCYRDTQLIADSVSYDVLFGSNYSSIIAGKAYYRGTGNTFISEQRDATVLALQEQKSLTETLLSANTDTVTRSNNSFDEIINIIENGPEAASNYTIPDPTNYDSGFFEARRLILSNKDFIQDEIIAWIGDQISSNTAPFSTAFAYDTAVCRRDVGFIVDSLFYDLTYRGNLATYQSAVAYFIGTDAQYGDGEKAHMIASLQHLQSILGDITRALTITPSSTNSTPQDVSGTPGSEQATTFAQNRIGEIISTITSDGVPPTKIIPDTTWPDQVYQDAFTDINNNKDQISNSVLIYITLETKSLLGAFIRSYQFMVNQINNNIPNVTTEAKAIVTALVDNIIRTLINPSRREEPSVITAVGHTWTAIMSGVALTKMPPAFNLTNITESILELDRGVVIASGQDDQGSALFVGGMEINADTGELSGPPFQQAVNRISTRAAISRSF